jgi:hypothetical protein
MLCCFLRLSCSLLSQHLRWLSESNASAQNLRVIEPPAPVGRLSRQGREETILESREKAAFQKIASSLSGGKKFLANSAS